MNYIKTANGNIEINETELDDLLRDQAKLQALEQAGIDNWDGYDYAMELFREWTD